MSNLDGGPAYTPRPTDYAVATEAGEYIGSLSAYSDEEAMSLAAQHGHVTGVQDKVYEGLTFRTVVMDR